MSFLKKTSYKLPSIIMVFSWILLSELDQIEMRPHGKQQLSKKKLSKSDHTLKSYTKKRYSRIDNLLLPFFV